MRGAPVVRAAMMAAEMRCHHHFFDFSLRHFFFQFTRCHDYRFSFTINIMLPLLRRHVGYVHAMNFHAAAFFIIAAMPYAPLRLHFDILKSCRPFFFAWFCFSMRHDVLSRHYAMSRRGVIFFASLFIAMLFAF